MQDRAVCALALAMFAEGIFIANIFRVREIDILWPSGIAFAALIAVFVIIWTTKRRAR